MANYDSLYEAAGQQYNVDPLLLKAIATYETGENPNKTGASGEMGMMQFMPATAAQYGLTPQTAYNPQYAVPAAARYLNDNMNRFTDRSGNVDLVSAVAAYNGSGPMAQRYAATVLPIYQRLAAERSQATPKTSDDPNVARGSAIVGGNAAHNDDDPYLAQGAAIVAGGSNPSGDALIDATVNRLRGGNAAPTGATATAEHQDAEDPDVARGASIVAATPPTPKPPPPAPQSADAPITADPYGSAFDGDTAPNPGAVGRVVGAAVAGATPALTAGGSNFGVGPETTAAMQRLGVFPPADASIGYKLGHPIQTLNEAGANLVAAPVNLLLRGVNALIGGGQAGIVQAGQEAENTAAGQAMARTPTWRGLIGIGSPAQLARDVASLPEAFPFGLSRGVPEPAPVSRPNMLLPQEVRAAAADKIDPHPFYLSQDFRANPARGGNPPAPSIVGETQPNKLLPPNTDGPTTTDAPGGAGPSAPSATAPNSVGAAATPPTTRPNMTPAEALAQRTQGERNRFNEPPRGQDSTIYIPGTKPTLAEVAGDPRASLQQKVVSQNPQTMAQVADQMQKNNDLAVQFYEDTAGSAQQLERMKAARDTEAAANLQAAFSNKRPTSVAPVQETIQSILSDARNQENTALQRYIAPLQQRLAKMQGLSEGTGPDGQTSLLADPEVLYGLREDLSRMLSKPALQKDPELAHVASQIRTVRDAMDGAIEQGAPGYAKYLGDYTAASNPIDAMEFLQDQRAGLTNSRGQLLPGKFNSLMSNIVEDRATGNPYLPASKLTDDQMDRLFAIHSQLKRLGNIDLSNPRGSDTNMLGQAVNKLGLAAAHGVAAHVSPVVGNVGIEMGRNALAARRANRLLHGVLNPDPSRYPPPSP